MGKHKNRNEKLWTLRNRLKQDEVIANRDIRAALGYEYGVYEDKLEDIKKQELEYDKTPVRSKQQRKAEKYIKLCLALNARIGDKGKRRIVDGQYASTPTAGELAGEAFAEMDRFERNEMNYWGYSETGEITFTGDGGDSPALKEKTPIYVDMRPYEKPSVKKMKNWALQETIDTILGEEVDDGDTDEERELKIQAAEYEIDERRGRKS
ncbi:MAG: hypothetical protein QF535_22600 [Anaerolineales bacterium]|nr:hypothetical protein [Anaerolineales bacterium]